VADDEADTDTPDSAATAAETPAGMLAPRPASELRKDLLVASGLFLFAFALYLLPAVLSRPLNESTELRAALAAREMLRSGDYVQQHLSDEKAPRPPMQVWLTTGTAQMLSGPDGASPRVLSRAVQMPAAVFAALTVLLITLFGCTVFGRAAGAIAGVVQAMSYLVLAYSQQGYPDPVLMFFCAASLCSAAWLVAHPAPSFFCALMLGASLGLAILTRAVFPAIFIVLPLLVALVCQGLTGRRIVFTVVALAVAATVAVPWFVMLDQRDPGAAMKVLQTALANLSPSHPQGNDNRWIFYPYHLLSDLLPFTLLLIPALLVKMAQKKSHAAPTAQDTFARDSVRFFAIAAAIGFITLYVGAYQRAQFMLPLMPALALCSGYLLSSFRAPGGMDEEKLAWSQAALGLLVALALVTMPFWGLSVLSPTENKGIVEILSQPLTMPVLMALGVGVLMLFLYGARQWVEGRPAAAVAALGIVAYAVFTSWNVYSVPRERRGVPLVAEHAKITDQLTLLGSDVKLYTFDMNSMQASLWLNRPASSLAEMAQEETGKTGAFAPQRVVLLNVDRTDKLTEKYGITPTDASPSPTGKLRIIPLPREQDWPALIGAKK